MNLILLRADELGGDGLVQLSGARADHVRDVLRARPGDYLRIGVEDGALGDAEVAAIDGSDITLRCTLHDTPPRPRDVLLLAIPRPRVLTRCLEHAAALGFGRIILFRSWRVDKSHVLASALGNEACSAALRRGLSQARRTHLPAVARYDRFKPFVEDELDQLLPADNRFVADPGATVAAGEANVTENPLALVIGPERGLLDYEVSLLAQHGFAPVHAGPHPQRVEVAVPLVYGQLSLRRTGAPATGRRS